MLEDEGWDFIVAGMMIVIAGKYSRKPQDPVTLGPALA